MKTAITVSQSQTTFMLLDPTARFSIYCDSKKQQILKHFEKQSKYLAFCIKNQIIAGLLPLYFRPIN